MTEKEIALINQLKLTGELLAEMRSQLNAQSMLLATIYQILPDDYKDAIQDKLVKAFSAQTSTAAQSLQASVQEQLFLLCPDVKAKMLNS